MRDQPGRELGVALELVEFLVGLEEGILRDIFGVLPVLRNMLRNPKNLPLILAGTNCSNAAVSPFFGALYEGDVGVDLFRNWRLDGWHKQKVAFCPV